MADELIDICDENNNLLGVRKMKSEAYQNMLWRRVVHIWIYNSKGEILLQLRAKNKKTFPDKWDLSVAGHISAGEEPIDSALREIEEEIGLCVKKEDLSHLKIIKFELISRDIRINNFIYVYTCRLDHGITNLNAQEDEVQSLRFVPAAKIEEELKIYPDKYTPNKDNYWFDVLNEVKRKLNINGKI